MAKAQKPGYQEVLALKNKGGRPIGSRNKATARREQYVARSGLTPLQYLLSVMRNDKNPQVERVDAAKAAAPYVHPKLANLQVGGSIGTHDLSGLSTDQLRVLEELLIHVVERADPNTIDDVDYTRTDG